MSDTTSKFSTHDVISADGSHLRAWTNGATGPTILLSNGLGTNPYSWPGLLKPDCGVNVVSWNHRGTSGSGYAVNERVDLDAFVEDAIAVMDDARIESCVIASWSAGVTVAFELLRRHPERVQGILAVAGVPGNTFATMLAPLKVPGPIAKQLTLGLAHTVSATGNLVEVGTRRIPWTRVGARALRLTRLIDPNATNEDLRVMLDEFITTHPSWYAELAKAVSRTTRISLSGVEVPTTFIGGRRDLLVGAKHVRSAADRVRDSRYLGIDGTHFLPLEFPDIMTAEIHALLERVASANSHNS